MESIGMSLEFHISENGSGDLGMEGVEGRGSGCECCDR